MTGGVWVVSWEWAMLSLAHPFILWLRMLSKVKWQVEVYQVREIQGGSGELLELLDYDDDFRSVNASPKELLQS